MLSAHNLSKRFGGVKAVDSCSFEVERGTIVGLIGPNGAGKSTVFNIVTGLVEPDAGKVVFKGVDITMLKPHQRANMGIARTFQLARVFGGMSVLDNVLLGVRDQHEEVWHSLVRAGAMRKEERRNVERCAHWLGFVGLHGKLQEHAKSLSYGQQKLLEIARALVADPGLLILDEPTAGVNPVMKEKIKGILKKLRDEGKTILLIEHDMRFVMGLCDKVVVLDHGQELAVGKPGEIQKDPRVLEAYLGK